MAQHGGHGMKILASRWVWFSALGALLVAGAVTVFLTGHQTGKPAAAVSTATSSPVQAAPARSGQAAPARSGQAAAATPSASPTPKTTYSASMSVADKILAWNKGLGGTVLSQVSEQAISVIGETEPVYYPGLAIACAELASYAAHAQADGPIPDQAAQQWYVRALGEFSRAAADCRAGAQSKDTAVINRSAAAINAGDSDMARVVAAMKWREHH